VDVHAPGMTDIMVVALIGVQWPSVMADKTLFAVEVGGGFGHEVLTFVVYLRGSAGVGV
jgi:hypothetical protein